MTKHSEDPRPYFVTAKVKVCCLPVMTPLSLCAHVNFIIRALVSIWSVMEDELLYVAKFSRGKLL